MDASSRPTKRFHELDALRGLAMLWGVFFHAAHSFRVIPVGWAIQDQSRSFSVDVMIFLSHMCRMPIFFLMVGFFARLLINKIGPAAFIRHRVKRILIPFIVGLLTIVPAIKFLWIAGLLKAGLIPGLPAGISTWQVILGSIRSGEFAADFSPAVLWFLYYLLVLYPMAMVIQYLIHRLPLDFFMKISDKCFHWMAKSFFKIFILALPTAFFLSAMEGYPYESSTPDTFVLHPYVIGYYSVFFIFGWFLHRHQDLVPRMGKYMGLYGVLAAGLFAAFYILYTGPLGSAEALLSPGLKVTALYFTGVLHWVLVFVLSGLTVRHLSRPSPVMRYVADSAYWVYLVHLPVVIFLQILLSDLAWPGFLKYLVLVGITFLFCYLSYDKLVRYTFIGTSLHGVRKR